MNRQHDGFIYIYTGFNIFVEEVPLKQTWKRHEHPHISGICNAFTQWTLDGVIYVFRQDNLYLSTRQFADHQMTSDMSIVG